MIRKRRYLIAAVATLATTAGYAGQSPFSQSARPDINGASAAEQQVVQGQAKHIKQAAKTNSVTIENPFKPVSAKKKTKNFLTSSWRKASGAVAGALTPKATVIPPKDDPVRLDTPVAQLGPDLYLRAARISENKGHFDEASDQYTRLLKIDPNHLNGLVSYARLHDRHGNFQEAVALYKKAVAAHPRSALAHNDLGLCLARQGQVDGALAELERAVKLQGDSRLYRNNLATVLVEVDRPDQAYAQLASIHSEAVARYNLAWLLSQRGNRQQALSQLTQAMRADPSFEAARTMFQSLQDEQSGGQTTVQIGDTKDDSAPATAKVRFAPHVSERPRELPPVGY